MNLQSDNSRRIHNLETRLKGADNKILLLTIKVDNCNKALKAIELQINRPTYHEGQRVEAIKNRDNYLNVHGKIE